MKFRKLETRKAKIIFYTIISIIALASCIAIAALIMLLRIDYKLVENPTYEINSENTVASLFAEINAGTIEDDSIQLNTTEIGEKNQEITLVSQLGTKDIIIVTYDVKDTIAPEITGESELSFQATDQIDILSNFKANDNSQKTVNLSIEGDYDPSRAGEYIINIVATDESNNISKKEIKLVITEPPRPVARTTSNGSPYYIEVNRQQNVVIVYSKDQNGNYTNVSKVFVASTGAPGSETPLGTFTVTDRYESLFLVGNVWGHYTLRINGPIFFHSVPYFTKGAPWDNLEYLEYNKLGNGASAGCVRLAAADAKWIYDNIAYGTTVKIYDSPNLPAGIVKPSPITIDINSPNRGWDPTDPDPNNPWR